MREGTERKRSGPVVKVRRDWGAILCDLSAAGVPLAAVARACCRDSGAVKAWAAGGDPKESDARVVLALYAKHCPGLYAAHAAEFAIHLGPGR